MKPLLTIFTAPKPFTNPHIDVIQRNAIRSWIELGDEVEVLLIGKEPGMDAVAQDLNVRQLPDVRCNEQGTPLVSDIFRLARENSRSPLLVYVNADIVFLPDLLVAARQVMVRREKFLMVGQRWDLDVLSPLRFNSGWEAELRDTICRHGKLHRPLGSDYFLFPRSCFEQVPDFAIGRAGWDNWMIYHALEQHWMVVDASPSVTIVHQNHDYSHLPDGKAHYRLPESEVNRALAGGKSKMYIILDADRQLVGGQLKPPPLNLIYLIRRMEVAIMPKEGEVQGLRWSLVLALRKWRTRLEKRRGYC